MAYEFEKAKHLGYQNLVAHLNPDIKVIDELKIVPSNINYSRIDGLVIEEYEKRRDTKLKHVFVIDGSKHEAVVKRDNLDFTVAAISVNQCVIDVKSYSKYLDDDFPLPHEYKKLKQDVLIHALLPLKGLQSDFHSDSKSLFRNYLYKILNETTNPIAQYLIDQGYKVTENETLLETYMFLANKISSTVIGNIQPCDICKSKNQYMSIKKFKNDKHGLNHTAKCSCDENPKDIYISDFLQFHEQLNTESSDAAITTQIMITLEKILMVNLFRIIEKNNLTEVIKNSAFVMDGTLALYGHSIWLSNGINDYIYDLKEHNELLLLSVEKTGSFVEYFKKVNDYHKDEPLKKGMLFFLNDDYIKNNIKVYQNDGFYGEKSYFGKKLFYKNHLNRLYVINLAFENEGDKHINLNKRTEADYFAKCQRMDDLIMLLENFTSQAYNNALTFVAVANEGVSISNNGSGKKQVSDFIDNLFKVKT